MNTLRTPRRSPVLALTLAVMVGWAAPSPSPSAGVLGKSAEITIGQETASMVERFLPVDTDPVALARVRRIGRRLVAALQGADYPYEFHVVEQPEINAFALPGGYVYIYRGLLQLLPGDEALAFVMGHEISHVSRRHSIRQFEKNFLLSAGLSAILAGVGARGYGDAAAVVRELTGLAFTRKDEAEADDVGIRLMSRAGFDPRAARDAMLVVKRAGDGEKGDPDLLRSHPAPEQRIERLQKLAVELIRDRVDTPSTPVSLPKPVARRITGLEGVLPINSEWMPLTPGSRWIYRTTSGGVETTTSLRVLEMVDAEPSGVYRVEHDLGLGTRVVHRWVLTRTALLAAADRDDPEAWREEFGLPSADGSAEERVTVPAGTFSARRCDRRDPSGVLSASLWFVRGVGLVKRIDYGTGTIRELSLCLSGGKPTR